MFRSGKWRVGWLGFEGEAKSTVITVLAKDSSENILLCTCSATASIPSQVAGYAVGCILINTATGAIYTNQGTALLCSFSGSTPAGAITPARMAVLTPTGDTSTAGTGGTFSISAAQLFLGYFKVADTKTGAFSIQLPSAVALQALTGFNATVGSWFEVVIYNGSATKTGTVIADSGATITLYGTVAIGATKSARLRFVNTAAGTMDCIVTVSS